jgi:sugar lactone lactonase YvrE
MRLLISRRKLEEQRRRVTLSMFGMRFLVLLLCLSAALSGAERGAKSHQDFRADAEVAYQRKDYAAAKAAIAAALALRPDSPSYLHRLAAFSALAGQPEEALRLLNRIAVLGVAVNVERDPDLASLQGTPGFALILRQFTINRAAQGEAEIIGELPGRTGIIEGIAFRPRTGDLFLGDVHHRCVWRRDRTGQVARFTADDEELLGIFGVAIDETRNVLWAAMTALPEMSGYTSEQKGQSALAEFNLTTSELNRVIPVPGDGRDHGLGDLTIGPDGTVYATDSKAPIIWKFAPDAEELEKVIDSPVFSSLQGIVLEKRLLLVADHANGLFAVDLATGNITALPSPKNATLIGLDGIVSIPGGIVAVQNGVDPQRVIRVAVTPELDAITTVTVVAAGLPNLQDLALITLVNDRPTLIAGTGWELFDAAKSKQPPAHTVRIFQTPLP